MRIRLIAGLVVGLGVIAAIGLGVRWYVHGRTTADAVFLIVVDTLRADRLSCYGYQGHDTPRIDGIAERGIQFEHAISVSGWTVPSMGALMTSMYPTQLGLVEEPPPTPRLFNPRGKRQQIAYTIAKEFTTLAEKLADAGYYAVAFVNQPLLMNMYREGYCQGFSERFFPIRADTVVGSILQSDTSASEPPYPRTTWEDVFQADSVLVDAFVKWMLHAPAEKLFAWIHVSTPHRPYLPPRRYFEYGNNPPDRSGRPVPQTIDYLSDLYDAEVRFTDDLVGMILDSIDRKFGLDRSLVVFTSDHGEEFGDHYGKDHGHSLYYELVHVPLIFAGPGIPSGERVGSTIRLIDVAPTILNLCGASPIDGAEGIDVMPLAATGEMNLPVYSEGILYGSTKRALADGGYRLMWDEQGDVYHLFNWHTDESEKRDVADRNGDKVERMREDLIAMHERLAADRVRLLAEVIVEDSLSSSEERAHALKAMRALGYINN